MQVAAHNHISKQLAEMLRHCSAPTRVRTPWPFMLHLAFALGFLPLQYQALVQHVTCTVALKAEKDCDLSIMKTHEKQS